MFVLKLSGIYTKSIICLGKGVSTKALTRRKDSSQSTQREPSSIQRENPTTRKLFYTLNRY